MDTNALNTTSYNIHIFGDSHSRIYSSPYLPNYICNVYYVGPITMFRIGRDKPSLDTLKTLSRAHYETYLPTAKQEYKHMAYPKNDAIVANDIVIYVFGEIDIRNHYATQVTKRRYPSEILDSLVTDYVENILTNKSMYPNVRFGIQSINPPVDTKNLQESIKMYPIKGTIVQRIAATLEINKLLKAKCLEYDLLFIDTASYYQNDTSLFPVNGLCTDAQLYELDPRIKDANVHIHMDNPEGIDHALKAADVVPNYSHYIYNKKCKYPSNLNAYQRETYAKLRMVHYVAMVLMYGSLFVPTKYIMFPIAIWTLTIIFNMLLGKSPFDCWLNILEFRLGNCNDKPTISEAIFGFPRKYSKTVVNTQYTIALLVLAVRTYIWFKMKK